MRIDPEPFREIRDTVGCRRVESGGILLGSRDDYHVRRFVFDEHGSCSPGGYDPDVDFLNVVVKREWEENRLALLGFVHSHPRGFNRLSGDLGGGYGDIGYLRTIFRAIPALTKFLVPIVYSTFDGGPFTIFPYVALPGHEEDYFLADIVVAKRQTADGPHEANPSEDSTDD